MVWNIQYIHIKIKEVYMKLIIKHLTLYLNSSFSTCGLTTESVACCPSSSVRVMKIQASSLLMAYHKDSRIRIWKISGHRHRASLMKREYAIVFPCNQYSTLMVLMPHKSRIRHFRFFSFLQHLLFLFSISFLGGMRHQLYHRYNCF